MGYGDAGWRGGAGLEGQGPGARDSVGPGERGRAQGSRVPRRMLLVALGGLLITGTTAAVAAAVESERPGAGGGGQRPAASGTAAAPRQRSRMASHLERSERARGGQAPAKPVYYVDDGPMAVALTIDDGPSPVYTPQVLRVLKEHGVTATFSMVGQNVASYPGIAREVASAGHAIANHTWSHPDMAVLSPAAMRDEITRAADEVHAATGQRPTLFRAPYGAWSPRLLEYCAAQGLTPLDWSVDPRDWARPGVTAIVRDILRTTRTGSVILEHDGGGDRSQTVAALKIVLPRLLDEGFRFRLP